MKSGGRPAASAPPAHDVGGLAWLALLIAATIFFGRHTFQLARATLRGAVPYLKGATGERTESLALRILRYASRVIVWLILPLFIIIAVSRSVLVQSPRDADTNSVVVFSLSKPWQNLKEVDPAPVKLLNFVGIRTFADLREVDVAEPPDGWDGNDWSKVKRVDLRARNLAFADLTRAFLANADLRGVDLRGAVLASARLQGADFFDEDRTCPEPNDGEGQALAPGAAQRHGV